MYLVKVNYCRYATQRIKAISKAQCNFPSRSGLQHIYDIVYDGKLFV